MGQPSLPSIANTPLSEAITWHGYSMTSDKGTFLGKKRRIRFNIIKTLLEAGADPNLTIHHGKSYRESQFEQLLEYQRSYNFVYKTWCRYEHKINFCAFRYM